MTVDSITDFTPWDSLDKFSDIEAAYLWNNLEPPIWLHALVNEGCEHPKAVSMTQAFLNQESENGRLTDLSEIREVCIYGMLRKVRGATTYSRQALRQCAERLNRRPLFLFPEYRQPPNTENTGSLPPPEKATEPDIPNNRARQSVKKLIDAALSLHYGDDWLNGDIETCADEFINELSHNGIDEPLERRTLINWFNQVAKHRRK